MYACLHWLSWNAVPSEIDGQPFLPIASTVPTFSNAILPVHNQHMTDLHAELDTIEAAEPFANATQRLQATGRILRRKYQESVNELTQDLVVKEQQIEKLAKELPGQKVTQIDLQRRIEELEQESKDLEPKLEQANAKREVLIRRLDEHLINVQLSDHSLFPSDT